MSDPFESQVLDLFPTGVITGRIPDAERLNKELKDAIARNRAKDPGIQRSNVLGWHSRTDMHVWGGEAARELAMQAAKFCDRFSVDRKKAQHPRFGWRAEMWANVSPPNASNQTHSHPGAYWSCVYYVDDGYDSPDSKQGGELVLFDPRYPMNRMYSPDFAFRWPDGRTETTVYDVSPKSGMIIGFPSWLNHCVRTYHGTRERISIAINLTLAPVPPQKSQIRPLRSQSP
jgi:uncharacterized protein (TIGR02466 family)